MGKALRRQRLTGDLRSLYAEGKGKAQQPGTAGYINSQAIRAGKTAPMAYTGATAAAKRPTLTARGQKIRSSLKAVQKAYASAGKIPTLDAEQAKVASTVLRQGTKTKASPRDLLAAAETGLVESSFRNLPGGDADSEGWRQERTSIYGTGAKGPQNVKASARRFFDEIKTEGSGADTPGHAAQGAQGSAYPDRYDAVESQARKIVQGFEKGKTPRQKDIKTLVKAGIPVPTPGAPKPKDTSHPLATKRLKNSAKLISPKWDKGDDGHSPTVIAKAISPVVKAWSKKYNIDVGAGYDPNGPHVSPGHDVTGTATDVYPKQNTVAGWDELERGIEVLGKMGFEVGYDGSVPGTQNWPNHGRGNHAHIEWVGNGSSEDAIKKLGGLTGAQINKIESGAGGGGAVPSSGGTSGASGGTSATSGTTQASGSSKRNKRRKALQKVTDAYPDSASPTSAASTSKKFSTSAVI